MKTFDLSMDISSIESCGVDVFKKVIKSKMKDAALKYLKKLQEPHTKVNKIRYDKLETQKYLLSPIFSNEETQLLYALRTRTVEGIKSNFKNMFDSLECPLKCWSQGEDPIKDTQQHLLTCSKLEVQSNDISCGKVEYEDLFKDVKKQKEATVLFSRLLEVSNKSKDEDLPEVYLDPSTGSRPCCGDIVLTNPVLIILPCGK